MTWVPPIRLLVTDFSLEAGTTCSGAVSNHLLGAAGSDNSVECLGGWHCKVHGALHGDNDTSAMPVLHVSLGTVLGIASRTVFPTCISFLPSLLLYIWVLHSSGA